MGHVVMEIRHGLAVAGKVSQAGGTAERRASEALLKRQAKRRGDVRRDVEAAHGGHVVAAGPEPAVTAGLGQR